MMVQTFAETQFLDPRQVNGLPASPAERIRYGRDPLQFGDLRLPKTPDRYPVAVVIHGGCWKARHGDLIADLQNTAALSSALTDLGIATWNIEYRRIDNPGGGWPGTFEDIANAVDYLQVLAKSYPLDLERVVVVGHSAGGHLGTWAAARQRLPRQSVLFTRKPLRLIGVVNLAGPANLEIFLPLQSQVCGEPMITKLMGGSPAEVPDRYEAASPSNLLPIGVKQILITGAQDSVVPSEFGEQYTQEAKERGDEVTFIVIENASHFEVIAPSSVAWPKVEAAVLSLLP